MNTHHKITFLFLFFPIALFSQTPVIDSLEQSLQNAQSDTASLSVLIELTHLMNGYDLEQGLEYGYQGLHLISDETTATQKAELLTAIGRIHANSSQPDSAIHYFEQANAIFEASGNLAGQARVLSKLQWVANYLGQYEKAATIAFQVLGIRESLGEEAEIGMANSDVGDALYNQGNYQEALDYALRGYEQLKTAGAPEVDLGVTAQLLADINLQLDELDTALNYANEALQLRQNAGDLVDIALSQNTRGNILKYMERYEEALSDYQEANEIAISTGFVSLEMATLNNIVDIYIRMEEYGLALPIVRSLWQQLQQTGEQYKWPEALINLSQAYEGLGQYDSALVYYKRYTAVHDSLFTAEADEKVAELQTRYETAQKEATIYQQQQALSRERTIRWYSVGIAGLLLVLALMLLQGYRTIRQKNRSIEALLYEIHHRVKNNLQVLSSLLSLQSRYIQDENALDAIREGQNRVDAMGLIHQQLYTGATPAALNMQTYLHELGETVADSFGLDDRRIQIRYEVEPVELDAETAIPVGLITNELITNALKYAFPDNRQGEIRLHFSRPAQGGYLLKVQDNGVGKAAAVTDSGTAFGTRLIRLLSQKLKARVEELEGTGYGKAIWFD